MSNCTQAFLITIKGSAQELRPFKAYYFNNNPLLFHKGNAIDSVYTQKNAQVWIDKPGMFSFFIKKFWRTNNDSFYSVENIAQKYPNLEFYNTFYIHHTTKNAAGLSSEGYEIFKQAKRIDFSQMALGFVQWDELVLEGIPDQMFEVFIKRRYVESKGSLPLSKYSSFKSIPKTGVCETPFVFFNDLIEKEDFFQEQFDNYSLIIRNQLDTRLINGARRSKYVKFPAIYSLLNFALKPYIRHKFPELRTILDETIHEMDIAAKKLLIGKMDKKVLLSYYGGEPDYYTIFHVFKENGYEKFSEIYKMIHSVNTVEYSNNNLPF